MAMYINTNVSSLNAQRNLTQSTSALGISLQRLSSGLRVNSAKDDAAGLAIATGMTSQIRGSNQAVRNANDGISLAQTAEGALEQIERNTQRMRELAIQGANATLSTKNRSQIKLELDQLGAENMRVIQSTEFNGKKLLNSASKTMVFQVGATNAKDNRVNINLSNILAKSAVSFAAKSVNTFATQTTAQSMISNLTTALQSVASQRAELGAVQNRFSAVVTNLAVYSENMSASRSRIMDADFAEETAQLTRNQIIQQAGTSMLAQANQLPQAVLSLLR